MNEILNHLFNEVNKKFFFHQILNLKIHKTTLQIAVENEETDIVRLILNKDENDINEKSVSISFMFNTIIIIVFHYV